MISAHMILWIDSPSNNDVLSIYHKIKGISMPQIRVLQSSTETCDSAFFKNIFQQYQTFSHEMKMKKLATHITSFGITKDHYQNGIEYTSSIVSISNRTKEMSIHPAAYQWYCDNELFENWGRIERNDRIFDKNHFIKLDALMEIAKLTTDVITHNPTILDEIFFI